MLSASDAGLRRIGLGHLHHVDPVQRRELIEVHDVIVQSMVDQDEIADVLRVGRNFQLQRVFHRADAGHGVHRGAYAAETLREEPGFARVAALENALDAAPHGAGGP